MKKFISLVLAIFAIATAVTSCEMSANQQLEETVQDKAVLELISEDEKEIVEEAIELLEERWEERYAQLAKTFEKINADWDYREYLEIKNVMLIKVKDTLSESGETTFGDVEYIVEFLLLDNFYGYGQDYCLYSGTDTAVVFYKNKAPEFKSLIRQHTSITYDYSLSDVDIEVTNLGSLYNKVLIDRPAQK